MPQESAANVFRSPCWPRTNALPRQRARVRRPRIRPLVREMDEHAKMPARADRRAVRPRRDGHRDPREYGGAGRQLLPLGAGGRGAVARRPVGRRDRRRAEHARRSTRCCAGAPTTQAALPAGAGRRRRSAPTRCRRPARAPTPSRWPPARRADGDDFALTGRKLWITNGNEADLFIVFATVNPEAGYRGITAFLVERGTPGLHRRQEGRQARHPREQHLRAALRGLPRAAGERARRGRQGLQGRDRDAERGPHRHRRADARPGAGRARPRRRVREGAQAVRQGDRRLPGRAVPARAQAATEVEAARLLVYNAARLRDAGPAVPHGGGDVQALRVARSPSASRRWPSTSSAATASPRTTRSRSSTATRRSARSTRARRTCSCRRSPSC